MSSKSTGISCPLNSLICPSVLLYLLFLPLLHVDSLSFSTPEPAKFSSQHKKCASGRKTRNGITLFTISNKSDRHNICRESNWGRQRTPRRTRYALKLTSKKGSPTQSRTGDLESRRDLIPNHFSGVYYAGE
ncbi:hypothetical protein QBC34DRAFT_31497 [Podospora aff. communis PSN243]|uniref:Secreted protein n=1 Tax=Podospora aff. communis PSN243 TaxID=3040156 RepID=A0AAV9GX21_9PEZI|nr:hypothetical protein QBC34DRAFT_31497 [Podospora aff. communis PSN243]